MSLRRSPATAVLLGLIALMWVLEGGLSLTSLSGNVAVGRAIQLGALDPPLVADGGWWRLIASAFIHWTWLHVLSNGVSLYFVGTIAEPFYRWWRYLVIYLASAMVGSLASLSFAPMAIAAGASGAVFGILGALLVLGFSLRGDYRRTLLRTIAFWIVVNLAYDLAVPRIDIWDHVGGLVAGIFTALAVGLPGRKWRPWNAVGLTGLAATVAALVR